MRRAVPPRSSGIALALIALAGCDRLPPLPVITSVVPAEALTDESSFLTVNGTGFSVKVFTDFVDPSQSRTDDTYQIFIGTVELTGVQHVSTSQLTGTLPVGVPVGFSDVTVIDPWTRSAVLAGAFYGFPPGGPPAALALTGAPGSIQLGACQLVRVEQHNAGGGVTVSRTPTVVTLDVTPASAFGVFSDSACTTPITSATIDPGQTSVIVYVQSAARSSGDLAASAPGLTSDSQTFVFGPTAIAFGTSAASATLGQCSPAAVTVVTRNPAGAASAVGVPTTVTLTVNPSTGLQLHDAAGCMGATVNQLVIPTGSSSAGFYFRGVGATGPYQVTAASTGLGSVQQVETINPGNDSFRFANIGAQAVHAPFLITLEAVDPLGNPVPSYGATATLAGQGGATVSCVQNCNSSTTTSPFLAGKWSGWVKSTTAASSAAVRGTSTVDAGMTGTSATFPVLAPDAGFSQPNARLGVRPGAVNSTGDVVTLDATLSSDYGGAGANLQYSFDARGMATTDAGTPPDWTSWSSIATSNGSGYSPGIWQPRVAVRNMANPNAIAYASATVVSVNGDVCEVDTTSLAVNGANTCNPPPPNSNYGSDGLLSLPEAIQIVNSGGARAITTTTAARFYFPPGAAVVPLTGGNWLSFASGTQLINAPFDFAGGSMLVANAEVTGARPWTVSGGDLTLSDVVLHDHVGIAAGAPLTLQRLLGFNCPAGTPCVDAVGPNGALAVTFSTFFNAPGGALRAAPATSGGPCPTPGGFALDVRSSTFQRASPGIQYDCTAPSRVVHTTFHENLVGISYAGGSSNTLQNDVFARNATAASCGAATFTAKDYNLVFQNGMDGCAGGDTNTLSGVDPLFFIPEATDLRLRASSQARNSALDLMLDVNDVGPLNFFGAGPDRGGRETP